MSQSPKEEMQTIICRFLQMQSMPEAYESLNIYRNTFGSDDFTSKYEKEVIANGPLVSLICLSCSDAATEEFLSQQNYANLEIVRTCETDSYEDIIDYMRRTDSKYICFLEENHVYDPWKIAQMVWTLEKHSQAQLAITPRCFLNSSHTVIAHPDYAWQDALKDTVFQGKQFLEHCITENINLYGSLSGLLISTAYVRTISWQIPVYEFDCINRVSLIYQLLLYGNLYHMSASLVSSIMEDYADDQGIAASYASLLSSLASQALISMPPAKSNPPLPSVRKHITFFYTDKGEYFNLKPIADEAVKRGYEIEFTDNITQKAEIGVYCQHVCYPENSKFSLILLHDLLQGHNRWPNIWEIERWNKFDIGILPGKSWASLWAECACMYYANPKYGAFEFGYPKSDLTRAPELKARAKELRQRFRFKYDFSVLYAPSWENDEKEDDFIRALASLKVNLLIKQAHWSPVYQNIINNIQDMRKLHENRYENVYYIEPEESIMTALELCDLVVSDESSVMSEAVMFGKPSIAVTDWLIPDTSPSRFACVPMDYVLKCKKVELREYVEKISANIADFRDILQKGSLIFSNAGNCCNDILDAIEYYTGQKTDCAFLDKKLSSKYTICSMWN